MRKVSEAGEDLLVQLISWEMLGRSDLDPKALLREVSLADLSVVASNIGESPEDDGAPICYRLVRLELMYRLGQLGGDWNYERAGDFVTVHAALKAPVSYVCINLST